MTKQELIQAAIEIKKICIKQITCDNCIFSYFDDEGATLCAVGGLEYIDNPADWDIERLEREE